MSDMLLCSFPYYAGRMERDVPKSERLFVCLAVFSCVVLLPAIVFVLIALWPQRVLVSWLLLGLVALVVVARIAIGLIHVVTTAKVRLDEEALRPGRLHAHERLIDGQEGKDYGGIAMQEAWRTPYSSQEKLVPHVYADGLAPLNRERDEH